MTFAFTRCFFHHDGLRLSYLDSGNDAPLLVALHAHLMEGRTYEGLARALQPAWRVVAPDQRGHGDSDHAARYGRDDYLGDLRALLDHLGAPRAVLMGNSLGGVNAYQFAARHPQRVRALVVEDIGAVVDSDMRFVGAWRGTFGSRAALADRVGPRLLPYVAPSFRETAAGWFTAFDPDETLASQAALNGDHWADWLATDCPALLLRGRTSNVSDATMFEHMAAERPRTLLVTLEAGHVVHQDDPQGTSRAVAAFLAALPDR